MAMTFFAFEFFVFFAALLIVYYIVPRTLQNPLLFIANGVFAYFSGGIATLISLLLIILYSYAGTLLVCKTQKHGVKKALAVLEIIGIVLFLVAAKYFHSRLHLSAIPLGISFYSLQAISYIIDSYRGKILPEKNIFRYFLFMSFFPQLPSGPIHRYNDFLQIPSYRPLCWQSIAYGLQRMLWGLIKKLVIAERAAIVVTVVFADYKIWSGMYIVLAVALYFVQLYADFSGSIDIALGAAEALGIRLPENFNLPFFAKNESDFWNRWHISLSQWLRDYIYIPVGGGRCSKWKKYCNVTATFLVSALWHGAALHFIVWGLLHGIYSVLDDFFKPYAVWICQKFHIKTQCFSVLLFLRIKTLGLVGFSWIFFRAKDFKTAIDMVKHLFKINFTIFTAHPFVNLGLTIHDWIILCISIFMAWNSALIQKKTSVRNALAKQNIVFRWCIYFIGLFWVLVFGMYGPEYNAAAFIYAGF